MVLMKIKAHAQLAPFLQKAQARKIKYAELIDQTQKK